MGYIDVPAKVLECFVVSQIGEGAWPSNDNSQDPFWEFGSTPRDYCWRLTIQVKPQSHSSHKTREPRLYNGMDVKVGDYIASTLDGSALKITRVDSKSDDTLVCVAEDVFRYNTFRDTSGAGNGLFAVPGEALIFEVNETGHPVVDPLPASGVGPSFYANLMSRFQNLERLSNFMIHQKNHGFVVGQLISTDSATNGFVLTDDDHPNMIGTISFVNGPDDFTVDPVQKVIDDLDYLAGEVGDVLFANSSIPGQLTTTPGTNPIMIKLRDNTQTVVASTIPNATTSAGDILTLNGVDITIGDGSLSGLANAVNLSVAQHGITAEVIPPPTIVQTDMTLLNTAFKEVLLNVPCSALINNTTVNFTTTNYGLHRYGDSTLATAEDMAADINAAGITDLQASVSGGMLVLTQISGGDITIVNGTRDLNLRFFAGPNSASGLPTLQSGSSTQSVVRFTAPDARAINLCNRVGSPVENFGLYSVENGVKAAALYIEQGMRKASNYVTLDITGRDALPAISGDQAYVLDKGDGSWGLFLYSGGGSWTLIASQETAKVDSDTYSVIVAPMNPVLVLGELSAGSKVTSVTFEVIQAFDGTPSLTVGDDGDPTRLAEEDGLDLATIGSYVVYPSYIYSTGATIKTYLTNGSALVGSVRVSITYQ